jgi:hypothetical protein
MAVLFFAGSFLWLMGAYMWYSVGTRTGTLIAFIYFWLSIVWFILGISYR